jgi:hypothetical protein
MLPVERLKLLLSGQANSIAYSERMNSKMRWLWRLLALLVLLAFLRTFIVPQPKAFIAWPEENNWALKIQGEIKQLQKFTQELPASIEVEVRRLWNDFRSSGEGKEV